MRPCQDDPACGDRAAILDTRALYPDAGLAGLYDELAMPPELRHAHQQNDRAVMEAYGMPIKETTGSSCAAELMRRWQALTAAEAVFFIVNGRTVRRLTVRVRPSVL